MYKPVILIGNGMRGMPESVEYLLSLGVPVLTTWMGADLVPEDHPTFCGRPGILGQRAANIIQQKADELFCFGARLDGEQTAYDYGRFAPRAIINVFDVDELELRKFPPRYQRTTPFQPIGQPDWLNWCRALYNRMRPELEGTEGGKFVDPFTLMRLLSDFGKPTDVFAIGSSGNAPTAFYQTFKVKAGQRITNASTIGAMGADIPMAMGAALASGRRTICVTGDGGFQLNAQELETIRRLHLPITFFVMSNGGYASIMASQDARFGRRTGADAKSGLTLPPLEGIAEAYRLTYFKLTGANLHEFEKCFAFAPMIVEVTTDPDWVQRPRVMAQTVNGELRMDDMQDMTPKIDDLEELMAA